MLRITHLVKVVLLMTPLFLILPGVAQADTCEAAQAVFEPTGTRGVFALRASEDQGQLLWQLIIQKTGETFPFRTETDTTGQTWLVSLPRDGEDPGIRTTIRLLDAKGTETQDRRAVSGVAVFDFWKVLSDYRTRKGQPFEAGVNPPANVWDLTECRAK
jgi:hypothetical protein